MKWVLPLLLLFPTLSYAATCTDEERLYIDNLIAYNAAEAALSEKIGERGTALGLVRSQFQSDLAAEEALWAPIVQPLEDTRNAAQNEFNNTWEPGTPVPVVGP